MTRVEQATLTVAVMVGASIVALLYLVLAPPALVRGRVSVMDEEATSGHWLRYRLDVCQDRPRSLIVHVFREIELVPDDRAGVINLAPPGAFVMAHRCEDREYLVQMPPVEAGHYLLRLTTITEAPPFASTQRVWTSAPFEVLPP